MNTHTSRRFRAGLFLIGAVGFALSCPAPSMIWAADEKVPAKFEERLEKLFPGDALKIATEHWDHLQELRRQHRDTLRELQKDIGEDHETGKLAEKIGVMGRVTQADLELCDTYKDRAAVYERSIRELEELRQSAAGATKTVDELMIKSARLGLEIEFERLKFNDRSPEEVRALLDQAKATAATYGVVFSKFQVGARGGEPEKEAHAGDEMCSRFAELLFALGKHEEAVEQLKQACDFADKAEQATQAAYDAGTVTLDLLLGSQHRRAAAWMALAKHDRKAAAESKGK